MYRFQYTLSEHDYFEFNKYHTFNAPANKKSLLINRFMIPIGLVICGAGIGVLMDEPFLTYYFFIAFGLIAILWLIFYKRYIISRIKKNIEQIKKSGKLPYQTEATISFEDDFFCESTDEGELKLKYTAIERVVTAEEAIYIYTNAIQAVILPMTVFADTQNRDDFLRFIEEKRLTAQQ